jgi:hypothetical protein
MGFWAFTNTAQKSQQIPEKVQDDPV